MENLYSRCRTSIDGFLSYDSFRVSIRALNFQSSPGYPFCRQFPTIGEWLGFDGFKFNELQVQTLWIMVQELVELDKIDCYWKVFIKQEPHKMSKVKEKKWRLIMCPPLDVQVLWQMTFSKQNDAEIDQSFSIPSQQGIILPMGGWKQYYHLWESTKLTHGMDMKNWDWTVSRWMIDADLEFRYRLVYGQECQKWKDTALKLYQNAFYEAKLLLSSGDVYQQTIPGIMKSGCVNTISTNSHLQVLLHHLYCIENSVSFEPMCRVVGDDKLVSSVHIQNLDWYQKYGVTVKEVNANIEFVGHRFTRDGPIPLYFLKHCFKLAHTPPELVPEVIDSYLRLYVNSPQFGFWMGVAHRLGLSGFVRSKSYYSFWYHNPMVEDFKFLKRIF